jgi:predicted nucleotidyltransferase
MTTATRHDVEVATDDPVLAEVVRRLVAVYQPEAVYPFGSHARGDVGPDSDYDVLVVVPDDAPPELQRSAPGYDASWGVGTAVDVLVCRQEYFQSRLPL